MAAGSAGAAGRELGVIGCFTSVRKSPRRGQWGLLVRSRSPHPRFTFATWFHVSIVPPTRAHGIARHAFLKRAPPCHKHCPTRMFILPSMLSQSFGRLDTFLSFHNCGASGNFPITPVVTAGREGKQSIFWIGIYM